MSARYVIRMLGTDYFMEKGTKRNPQVGFGVFDKNTTIVLNTRTEALRAAMSCGRVCEIVEVFGV